MSTISTRYRNAAMILLGVAAGLWFATCAHPTGGSSPSPVSKADAAPTSAVLPAPPFARTPNALSAVAERAVDSVVNISATRVIRGGNFASPFENDPFFRHFFGPHRSLPREREQRALGSGVIVSDDGVILTNNHVVERAEAIEVTLKDGTALKAEVVGTDPESDLAVVRLKGEFGKLQPLHFGDSSSLRLGDVVLAIGNPFGVGQTVTMGIVSATGRASGLVDYEDFIQTDAAINPGNSGGALVNLRGELVGVNTAILSHTGGYQGVGFAIPSDMAEPIMKSLLDDGKVERGWLGVAIQDLNEDLAKGLGLKIARGVLVSDVVPDSPADKAGLKRNDVVLSLNGKQVENTRRFRSRVATLGPSAKAELTVSRGGNKVTLTATLGTLSDSPAASSTAHTTTGPLAGLKVTELTAELRKKYQVPSRVDTGVVVTEVDRGSEAARAGLREGDVIAEIDRKPVKSVGAFEKLTRKAGDSILLLVLRDGQTFYLMLR